MMDRELLERRVVDALVDTSGMEETIAEDVGLPIDELESIMGKNGYERCNWCDTWCEMSEFVDDDNDPTDVCGRCR